MFIVVDGLEAVGKSTVLSVVCKTLTDLGHDVVQTREPGGTRLAEEIRSLILSHHEETLDPMAELLLAQAARVQHTNTLIKPALLAGKTVISDRYVSATYAYQGYGRELGADTVFELHKLSLDGFQPDLMLWLDCDLDIAAARKKKRGIGDDRIEAEDREFFERCRRGFKDYQQRYPDIAIRIDASGTPEQVAKDVISMIHSRKNAFSI